MPNNINKSKVDYDKIYLTYNQITKEYDVYILSENEYDQLSNQEKNNVKYMILRKKNGSNPPSPPQPPVWFQYWCENSFKPAIKSIEQRLDKVEQRLDKVEQRLDKVEQRLDKVEQRLDKVEQRLDKVERRLDKVEQRLDNIIQKNNLKE